MHLLFESKFYI